MLRYYPIQVRENAGRLDILDGQHRFFIAKQLKRPVFYILVTEEKSMPDIAKINSNVEKWKSEDFINCYVQFGNDHYIKLQQFLDDYGFSLGIALSMLHVGTPGKEGYNGLSDMFREGLFEVRAYDAAKALAENCKLFNSFKHWKSRAFVIAIDKIVSAGLYDIKDLLTDYKKRPDLLTEQANYKSYINTLEQMVNVGKHKRVVIA